MNRPPCMFPPGALVPPLWKDAATQERDYHGRFAPEGGGAAGSEIPKESKEQSVGEGIRRKARDVHQWMQARGWTPVTGQRVPGQYGGSLEVVTANDPNTSSALHYTHPQYGNVKINTDLPPLVAGPMRVVQMSPDWSQEVHAARAGTAEEVKTHVQAIEAGRPMNTQLMSENTVRLQAEYEARQAAHPPPPPPRPLPATAYSPWVPRGALPPVYAPIAVRPRGAWVSTAPGAPRWSPFARTWVWPEVA
jgi:hypothetical protein